jgi:sugar transferase (PEP-CTERM/EpsH1 system associated)
MANLLYLVHRLPYPPNKGDKVRSYHMLKHLASSHKLFVGTFVDDPDDECHIETVAAMCSGLHAARLHPAFARPASLGALLTREPLTLRYYRDAGLQRWVERTCSQHGIDAVLVFSSVMAQYTKSLPHLPLLVDFVDVDSAKWDQYSTMHRWPISWLYRREGALLLAYERKVAARAERSFFVTEKETALFRQLAPESMASVEAVSNGVCGEYFSVSSERVSPFRSDQKANDGDKHLAIVFTGAMDYWPNIDAVTWFAREVMPPLLRVCPAARFHIVGRNPVDAVKALASEFVAVTGTVTDVRPYLQHACVVVAPLRLARGVQNKVLEAMAMQRPVVVSETCAQGIDARNGVEFFTAATAQAFVDQLEKLLRDPELALTVGRAARRCVLQNYSWKANLSRIDRRLADIASGGMPA